MLESTCIPWRSLKYTICPLVDRELSWLFKQFAISATGAIVDLTTTTASFSVGDRGLGYRKQQSVRMGYRELEFLDIQLVTYVATLSPVTTNFLCLRKPDLVVLPEQLLARSLWARTGPFSPQGYLPHVTQAEPLLMQGFPMSVRQVQLSIARRGGLAIGYTGHSTRWFRGVVRSGGSCFFVINKRAYPVLSTRVTVGAIPEGDTHPELRQLIPRDKLALVGLLLPRAVPRPKVS